MGSYIVFGCIGII